MVQICKMFLLGQGGWWVIQIGEVVQLPVLFSSVSTNNLLVLYFNKHYEFIDLPIILRYGDLRPGLRLHVQ